MSSTRLRLALPCVLGIALLCEAPARADLVTTVGDSFSGLRTNFNLDSATNPNSLLLPRFNTEGGKFVLVGAEVTITSTIRTTVTIPTPPINATVTVTVGTTATPTRLRGADPFGDNSGMSLESIAEIDPIVAVNSFPSGTFTQTWERSSPPLTRNFTDPAQLARFIGAGEILFAAFGQARSSYQSSTGNGAAIIQTTADASVSITYTFTSRAIPEPASLGLVGLGAFGLGVGELHRRRKGRVRV